MLWPAVKGAGAGTERVAIEEDWLFGTKSFNAGCVRKA